MTDNSGAIPYSATYTYVANSPLVSQIVYKTNTTTRMTTTKSYDFLNRLTSISSVPSGASTVSFVYTYNNANQRVRVTMADGSYWLYIYDQLGQVISGHKFWSDGSPVAGQMFDYAFDSIGNRTSTLAGGDQNGLNQRSASYTANALNQYTQRTVPGDVDVMGISYTTNSVSVNGNTAYRKVEYFRDQLPVNNSSAALWTNIIVSATGQTSVTGNVFVAQSLETFGHDADGNMTNDGRWVFTWDGENRLVSLQGLSGIPTGAKFKLDFVYDAGGRRVQKLVSTNSGSAYYPLSTNRFLYDGWNLTAVVNPASSVVQSFMWGADLSGTLQGAGGVAGLLEINDVANGVQFPAFDGSGNVASLVKGTDGTVSAGYEYGPFGEVTRSTGTMARANPVRFSTKYQDNETDLVYYGYRYYSATEGRWLNRDPMDEGASANLYCMVENQPSRVPDKLGLCKVTDAVVYYRVKIADADSGLAEKPHQELADAAQAELNRRYIRNGITFPRFTSSGPFSVSNDQPIDYNGLPIPAGAFIAGHFLFFVDFQIDESDGPCALRFSEDVHGIRSGSNGPIPPPYDTHEGPIFPREGWRKVLRKPQPGKGCGPSSLVWRDIPGSLAFKGPPAGAAYGFVFQVHQTLEVASGYTDSVVYSMIVDISIGVDLNGVVSSTP